MVDPYRTWSAYRQGGKRGTACQSKYAGPYYFLSETLSPQRRKTYCLSKSAIACEAVYGCCLPPIKLSILALYHRLFPSRRLYHIALFIAAIVIGTGITQTLGFSLQCVPLSKAWTGGPGKCINSGAFATTMALSTRALATLVLY